MSTDEIAPGADLTDPDRFAEGLPTSSNWANGLTSLPIEFKPTEEIQER